MSASPTAAPTQSAKRPLEDPSSPSAPNDQPEAKRPALDKIVKGDDEEKPTPEVIEPPVVSSNGNAKTESTNGSRVEPHDGQGDTLVPDVGSHSIESTATISRGPPAAGSSLQHDESGWIHIRAVITSAEAATVIGKGGENVSLIRKMSGAKCTVSDYQKGAVERILTVSGVVDAVAKVCSSSKLT
jgi:heterogeneous nuclear rnp K-like protein